MRLMHNLESLNIYREHTKVISRQSEASNRISSGYKINSAKENPNAIANSEKMRIQIRGLQMAQRNTQDGVSMLQTADGALDNVTSMLQRIRELTVQSGGATTKADRETIQQEISQMIKGIDDIIKNTEFNGVSLLNAEKNLSGVYNNDSPSKTLKMSVGANVGETVDIPLFNLNSNNIGVTNPNGDIINGETLSNVDITDSAKLGGALKIIDAALNAVILARSKYGALENRFESTYNKIGEIHDTIVGAESNIRDADIAEEMMNYTRDNLLIDAGHAMMVQTNKMPQEILRILENVRSR
ncbi:flagellin [Clostridium bovifaecis]|uniref:Flagellin n=1 Tax=Clostridium bovifaecis TaxID=2184719 RepID=A0A6I6F3W7_9CLOT|nr:flagellin [Clostridium bovifaecis]